MSELFREIEEDIKRERIEKLWSSFGRAMVLVSIGLVAATAVFVAWQNYTQSKAEAKTSQFMRGIDRFEVEDYKGAVPIFSELSSDDSSAYYPLAMLRKAQAQELGGDIEGAKKTYGILSKKNTDFSAIAKLKMAENGEKIDTHNGFLQESPQESPFYYTLAEYKAWQLLADGKKAEAIDGFVMIMNDKNTPLSLAARTREILRTIAPEKLGKSE